MPERTARIWSLDETMLDALEIGSGILGAGGGGNPYLGKLRARRALREGHVPKMLPLAELQDDARIVSLGGIGAPLVSFERIRQGREGLNCLRAVEERLGLRVDAIACEEIGGANAMEPLIVAAFAGLPVVDCDGMGRAFPEMQMTTYAIYGHCSTPSALCDVHGNIVIFDHAVSEKWRERMARACVVAQGGASVLAGAPMTGAFVKRHSIPGSYTRAIALGNAVLEARRAGSAPIAAICANEDGAVVFRGKINELKRHLRGGFVSGEVRLIGFDDFAGDAAGILIQNENLVFSRNGKVEVIVPDLIVILDTDTGGAITTEMLRYGQRVTVLALPSHPLLRTPEALDVVGPAGFGFTELTWRPMRAMNEASA